MGVTPLNRWFKMYGLGSTVAPKVITSVWKYFEYDLADEALWPAL